MTSPPPLAQRVREALDALVREVMKFGTVGAVAFVVDTGLFNLLRFGVGDGGPLEHKPLTAKVISTGVASVLAWIGNRTWTFRHRRRSALPREVALFALFNVAGMGIAVACLWFSHYVLDLRTPLADNLSANGVGLVLGTLFRFWTYRTYVFTAELDPTLPDLTEPDPTTQDSAVSTQEGTAAPPPPRS